MGARRGAEGEWFRLSYRAQRLAAWIHLRRVLIHPTVGAPVLYGLYGALFPCGAGKYGEAGMAAGCEGIG